MAVLGSVDILAQQTLYPADARDPLGMWGGRVTLTGIGDGGSMKIVFNVPELLAAAYVFTVYSAIIVQTGGTPNGDIGKCRILTNWPNIDPDPGIQAYGTTIIRTLLASTSFTAPFAAPTEPFITPNDRFLLIYNPQQPDAAMSILELEFNGNVTGAVLSFEAYGYFWDREVMTLPGGPRHPGSN